MGDPLVEVAVRMYADFADRTTLAEVLAVVARARNDLDTARAGQQSISDPIRMYVDQRWRRGFAVAHLRRSGSVRLAGERWMSRLDVGQPLGPAGLHCAGGNRALA